MIRNAEAFHAYLIYSGLDTSIQAGEYKLSAAMSTIDIARKLQDATPEDVTFVILPGWRMEEIAASLPTSACPFHPTIFSTPPGARIPNMTSWQAQIQQKAFSSPIHISCHAV